MLTGLLDATWWQMTLYVVITCHITLLGVTLYLHRCQAHRALELHPVVSHFFRLWLWLFTSMVTREWVAVHRKHHARCETDEDPHSPQVLGLGKVLLEGAELYNSETHNEATVKKFSVGCPEDWVEHNVYQRHQNLGIMLVLVFNILMFGMLGITLFALQMLCIPVLAAGVINGIGHFWGYRNFECDDAATNIVPFAILIAGEELHNNHHAYPSSAKFSMRRWEFDVGWMYICVLRALGLAKVRRVAPRPQLDEKKVQLDIDTVKALIVSRMHVMESYARGVIKPVHRMAMVDADSRERATLAAARKPLIRAKAILDQAGLDKIAAAIGLDEDLATVYEFRTRLQAIWSMAGANHDRLVSAFQEWCAEAEASGIASLQEFAQRLRGYAIA